jgi:hypothetical protein
MVGAGLGSESGLLAGNVAGTTGEAAVGRWAVCLESWTVDALERMRAARGDEAALSAIDRSVRAAVRALEFETARLEPGPCRVDIELRIARLVNTLERLRHLPVC